jgi:hypothetical protein
MYVIRNVFQAKPGRAKDLVEKFAAARPHIEKLGIRNTRLMTDAVAGFWTVVIESETEDLQKYTHAVERMGEIAEVRAALDGYMELVEGGRREIFHLE